MDPRSLEDAFACFRREHDLEALAEVFDSTAPELLEVARHMTHGRGEAEDLVQATFLAALEAAPRFEAGRELVPWLVGILANLARRARERRRAVGEPGAELADPRAPDPAARAAESEFRTALERALVHVPPRYREVLASHLGEGRAPEEIARELGRAPGTVRVQLHRGVRQLRRLLPAGFALGALGLLAPRGLAAVRANVLRAARGGPVELAPALTLGGMLVMKKLALGALALFVAASVWWLARGGERGGAPSQLAAAPREVTLAPAAPELLPVAEEGSRAPVAEPGPERTPASAEPYGALTVVLAWWDGTPAAGIPVSFVPADEPQPAQAFQLRTTDAAGRARVERIHAGEVALELARFGSDGAFRTEVERGLERDERITLARACDVIGRVLDASGAPVAGAQLWVREYEMSPGHAVERAGDDGTFRVRSVPRGYGLFATAAGRGSSEVAEWDALEPVDPFTRRVELRLRGESAELEGRVTDSSGALLAGALVSVRGFATALERPVRTRPLVVCASDADGGFHVGGLQGGGVEVVVAAAGFAMGKESVHLEVGRTARLSIVLGPGFEVRGTVALPDGSPASGTVVQVLQYGLVEDDLYPLYTRTDEHGVYALTSVPAGPAVFIADYESDLEAQTGLTGRAGERLTWNVTFGSGPSIRGRARDAAGTALAGWKVRAFPNDGHSATITDSVRTDERGAFVLPDLADALYRVMLYAPEDEEEAAPRAMANALAPGGAEVELVVRGEREPTAALLGRVLDPDGKPVRPEQFWARRKDDLGSFGDPEWSTDDRFRIGPMFSGAYELSITLEPETPSLIREFVLAEGEELDLGDLQFPRWGEASLTVRGPDGGRIPQPATLFLTEGRYAHVLASSDGLVFESGPMWPGTYSLRAMSGSAAPAPPAPIEIRPGETTRAEVALAAGRSVIFDFRVPDGERLPRRLRIEVHDEAGALLFEQDQWPQSLGGDEFLMASGALPLGACAYSARSEDGWSATGTLALEAGPELQLRVPIQLVRAR